MGLFEGYGIELEYMIVRADSLDVLPLSDEVLRSGAGRYVTDFDAGPVGWSNELVLHLLELKSNGPVKTFAGLGGLFRAHTVCINSILEPMGGRLMPTGMHPWMDPAKETRLWRRRYRKIYETYDRIFNCSRHGWANLQSVHLNLPFRGDEEFGRLHAAVRLLLPILPALAASSPAEEGRLSGLMDTRLFHYGKNQGRIPSISGKIIPEPVYSRCMPI
jgi:gamma-glutamyl:cysteine ligase YbdK (ATP-grasp superfamily)